MRIILIHPWIYDFAAYNLWARPLGLLRVAERLSRFTRDLVLIDCLDSGGKQETPGRFHTGKYFKTILDRPPGLETMARHYGRYGIQPEVFRNRLRQALPSQAILVTSVMTYWYPGCQEAIRICREEAPDTPVILGGLYPRFYPEHARQHAGADWVFTGRAEDPGFEDLLRQAGLNLPAAGQEIPYYDLHFYPEAKFAPLLTSRGCPYRCSYCGSHFLEPELHQEAPEKTVEAIKTLASRGVEDFAFYDDALLYRAPEHLHQLLERVIAAEWPIRFHTPNGLHARYLDLATSQLMRQAGFKTIRLSLETVDTRRQAATGGKVGNVEFETALENLARAGFAASEIGVYLMYGLPGQPLEEVWEGVRYLKRLGVRIHLTEFSPLPHTPAWADLRQRNILPPDPDPLLTNNTVFASLFSGYPEAELRRLKLASRPGPPPAH